MIKLAESKGYTLLEVLVVVSILSVVLVPVSVFFQEYIRKTSSDDLLANSQLARAIMEQVLNSKSYFDRDTTIILNNRTYNVKIRCESDNELVLITVQSQRSKIEGKPLILKRYAYVKEQKQG